MDLSPTSTGNPFRRRRVATLGAMIAEVRAAKAVCRLLDIGGTRDFWHTWREHLPLDGVEIDCVNIDRSHASGSGYDRVRLLQGDARDLHGIDDRSYDIAFSNSVIEHVGAWSDMLRMAGEVRRVADRYLVQTPYFWFPIEPHMRAPFVHWLPDSLGYRMVMARRLGFFDRQETVSGAMAVLRDSRLLDLGQMRALFPDAAIEKERFLGWVKSMIAIRR